MVVNKSDDDDLTLDDETYMRAKIVTKNICDDLAMLMETHLRSECKNMDNGVFQGVVCDLIASYMLSHTLKILELNGVCSSHIRELCEGTVHRAHQFARAATFTKISEH